MERVFAVFILEWEEQPNTFSEALQQSGLRSCSDEPVEKTKRSILSRTKCIILFSNMHFLSVYFQFFFIYIFNLFSIITLI